MAPELAYLEVNGARLAYFETGNIQGRTETILFVHAAICHARCWDATINALESTCRTIAIELRGHGRSEKQGPYGWDQFGADVSALVELLDLNSIVAVGHSMGGHILIQTVAKHQDRFKAIVLVEPAVFDPRAYELKEQVRLYDSPEEHPASRRRLLWDSPVQWFEKLSEKAPYRLWDQDILWDYCQHGLSPLDSGKYELLCPPWVEAEVYMGVLETNVHSLVPSIRVPVTVLRGKTASGIRHPLDAVHSLTWPKLANMFPNGEDRYIPEVSHFIPMQRPDIVAKAIERFLSD